MVIIYGIANCDTVKKARTWLTANSVAHHFHDFKKSGVPTKELSIWLKALGHNKLLARHGSTWRKLGAELQLAVHDDASATALMLAQPSVIKRPVVWWHNGGAAGTITVGFDADVWQQFINPQH